MNSIKKGLGMRKARDRGGPSQPANPHSNAVFTQVHNTLALGGGNDARGRVFLLPHVRAFILPDGGRRLPDYNQLRRAAVLSILPAALYYSWSCIFMQHHKM
jgi:hypothetical protein